MGRQDALPLGLSTDDATHPTGAFLGKVELLARGFRLPEKTRRNDADVMSVCVALASAWKPPQHLSLA